MQIRTLLRTSVFQLTLIYVAVFSLSALGLIAFIYWSTIGYLERQTIATIEADIAGLAEQYERRGLTGLVDVVAERVRRDTEGRSVYLFADAGLRPLAGNIDYWPTGMQSAGGWVDFIEVDRSGQRFPVRARVLRVGPGLRLMVGRDIRELNLINQVFQRASVWGTGATLALSLLGGLLMSSSAQRRVSNINRTTRQIMAGDLSQRVPVSGSRDEHDELANHLNAMLDQIESLLAGMRHVADSVAHDLRSPLTRLRNRLEALAGRERPHREEIAECLEQADGLLETFNALLRIARIESGAYRSAFEHVEVGQVVGDVCELYQAAADEQQIELVCECSTPATVFGDRELLAQALTNLLDNALKYTPSPGRVEVKLEQSEDRVRISVVDTGSGIPASERERVLQRFARLDDARSRPGNGLGLALVKAVAEQHHGTLRLDDNSPGLIVSLELPAAAAPQRPA